MALLCAKCGAQMPAGTQICTACGAAQISDAAPQPTNAAQPGSVYAPVNIPGQTAATGSQTAAGSPPSEGYTPVLPPAPSGAGYSAASAYPGPPAVPGKSGSSALKIVLIIIAVLVGLGIVGVGAVGFIVLHLAPHAVHMTPNAEQVTVSTPGGAITAGSATSFTTDDLGTEIYPGAQSTTGGMRMSLPTGLVVSAVYLTPDSKEQVVSFYKSKLGSEASVYDGASNATISLRKKSRESIVIGIVSRPTENNGKTKISIVHTAYKSAS